MVAPKKRKESARYMYILLTQREVNMAGYWPSYLFAFFMDRDEVEVHKNAKRE